MTAEPTWPPVAEMVAGLERGLSGDPPEPPDRLGSLLLELHGSNLRQWDLEDATRLPDASDKVVADAKRAIDRLNLSRHCLIQEIDAAVLSRLDQSGTAPLATETPGMVLDRLSVLVIRIARTAQIAGSGTAEASRYATRLPSLRRQLAGLTDALETLLGEVRDGARRFLPYEHLKLYSPQPGRGAGPGSEVNPSGRG